MSVNPGKWYAVSVTVPAQYTDAIENAFGELDCLGTGVDLLSDPAGDRRTVTAYFSSPQDLKAVKADLSVAARIFGLPPDVDLQIDEAVIEDQDWLAEWKKYWKPTEMGRFVVAAPWHEVEGAGKTVIRIEPNMAFGTGTHETTQLCLAAIDENYRPWMSFLDVGTGTGLLAIAAASIADPGVRLAAVDIDVDAVAIAAVNAKLNGAGERIEFAAGTLDSIAGAFDFVCANLTADVILPLLPELIRRTRSTLVLSGILAEQEASIVDALPASLVADVRRAGEWITLVFEMNR
jgi:ribosomal protein L11 methyltransferase